MPNELFLTKDQLDLLKTGTIIKTNKETFYYLPYWFKKINEECVEIISPDNLPESLKEQLNKIRQ